MTHFADSEGKVLRLHTEKRKERTVGRNCAEAIRFSSLCRVSWEEQKDSDPQLNASQVCRPQGRDNDCAQQKFQKTFSNTKNQNGSKQTPIPPFFLNAASCCVSGSHDAVGIPDVSHGILLHLWPPSGAFAPP